MDAPVHNTGCATVAWIRPRLKGTFTLICQYLDDRPVQLPLACCCNNNIDKYAAATLSLGWQEAWKKGTSMANGDVQQSSEWISLADWPDATIRVTVGSLLEFRSENQTVDWGVYLDEDVVAHFVPSSVPESRRGLWEVFTSLVPLLRPTDGDVKNTEVERKCSTVDSDGVVAPLVDNINPAEPLMNPDTLSRCVGKSEPVAEVAKESHGMILRTDRISILLKSAHLRVCIPVERSEKAHQSGKDIRDLVLMQPDRASPVLTLDAARVYLEKNLCSQLVDSGMSIQPPESSRSEALPVSLNGGFSSQVQMSGEAVAAYAVFGFVGVAVLSWWRRNR